MALGMPVAIALGLSSLLTILFFAPGLAGLLSLKLFETSEHYTLLAIPFFVLAGVDDHRRRGQAHDPLRQRLRWATCAAGWRWPRSWPACCSRRCRAQSPATVVAVGSIVIAGMVKPAIRKPFAAGVICNAGTLGILIPPSIVMVVYAAVTEVSVGKLFMAGVMPGILLGLLLMAGDLWWRARKLKLTKQPRASRARTVERSATRLGPAADGHHHGRHLRRHLHARPRRLPCGGVRLRRRGVHLPRHRLGRCRTCFARCRQGHGDADVHHGQRAAVRARADHRAHPAADAETHHRLGHAFRPGSS
jgi:hypothetical protein